MEARTMQLDGADAPMPFGTCGGSAPPQQEGMIDLTKPSSEPIDLPMHIDVFGPPSVGQEGHEAFVAGRARAMALANGIPTSPMETLQYNPPDLPRSEESDLAADQRMAKIASPLSVPPIDFGFDESKVTPVTFIMADGAVKVNYPLVIINNLQTCIVLGAKDPPPGTALFIPGVSDNMQIAIGPDGDAIRYTVVSFQASFTLGPWNMLVLALRERLDD